MQPVGATEKPVTPAQCQTRKGHLQRLG
jgi:hypothetical protein